VEGALLYEPARIRALALTTAAAIQWLDGRTSDEPVAESAIATLRRISHNLGTAWMPNFAQILGDTSMATWDAAAPAVPPRSAPNGFRSTGTTDDDRRPDQIAADMVELADRAADGEAAALFELDQMLTAHGTDPAVMFEFRRQLGDEGFSDLVVALETGTMFVAGAVLAHPDVLAARDRVLAELGPTPMQLPTNPDFELAAMVTPGGDWTDNSSEWSSAINPRCADLGGPNADYRGGGFVTGPDGLPYAIVVPWVQDGESQFTADVGGAAAGAPCVGNLNGADDGWAEVGYQSGIERFQHAPTPMEQMFGFFAGTTGMVVPMPPSSQTQFIQMRPRDLPYLAAAPHGAPPPIGSALPSAEGAVGGTPSGQAVIDVSVRGSDGWVFATNMDNQRERAYQIVFEATEDGRRRARIETFTLGYDANGDVIIVPEHVWVNADGELMSELITYAPPPEGASGVLSDVTPISFAPGVVPNPYVVSGQEFP
jgi:hypothetical protein